MRHVLICGEVGVGKSTLIEKLLRKNARPLCGFVTKRLSIDENGIHKVYIHPAVGERQFAQENLIGTIDATGAHPNPQAFDTYGAALLNVVPDGLVLMDELGFLESRATVFCDKILKILDGDAPVLAAVKSKDTPFLIAVKTHPKVTLYTITEENRDDLYERLIPIIEVWGRMISRMKI